MPDKVAFCVPANINQTRRWWQGLTQAILDAERDPDITFVDLYTQGSAAPDFNKDTLVESVLATDVPAGELDREKRLTLTDANRNNVVDQASEAGVDWLYWWDDDTVHPRGALKQMLSLRRPFVSGMIHLKEPPFVPMAYFRNPNGTYRAMLNFEVGELVEVDFCGMGCALIHRSVYERIRAAHTVFKTTAGAYLLVQNELVQKKGRVRLPSAESPDDGAVYENHLIMRVKEADDEELKMAKLHWPYYALEATRSEDEWFCQLAANVGIKPTVDTSIDCQHLGIRATTGQMFRRYTFTPKDASDAPESKPIQ